jgi:hypothetical protein
VLLLSAVSVLSAWEFARRSDVRWLALAAAFSTCGVVMHYEFALLAPALVAVAWAGWRRAPDRGQVLRKATPAALLSAIVIAAVYVPLLLSPHSAKIQRQLIARLGGLGAWGLPSFVEIGTLYNAGFFILGLMLLAGVGLLVGWHRARRQTYLLVLWFLPSLILLILVMRRPGTHFYLLMPSWSLLAALPLAALAEKRHWPWLLRGILWGLAVVWLALSLGYLYLAFFRQAPEYILHYEEERLPIYAAPYGEQVPLEPRFGFPIHEGWKTLGLLARWGCLGGTYATNEGSNFHQLWYIRDLTHTGLAQSPDYLFVAEHVQAPVRARDEASFEGYYQVGSVKVRDEPRIEIWTNQILPVPYVTYQSEDFAPLFDSTVPALDNGSKIPLQTLGYRLGAGLLLESVGLAQTRLRPGDRVHLMLVWHPKMALAKDYKVFVHLVGDNAHPLAQWDGYPCFNLGRTSQWVPGALITDHLLLPIPDELPPGQYRLLAGMYEESSGERLGGWALEIGRITVY